MDDLIAFLRARLDEVEAEAAGEAKWLPEYKKRPGDWGRFLCDPVIGPFGGQSPLRDVVTGLYVSRVADPGRVLREVEAKRAVLARYERGTAGDLPEWKAGRELIEAGLAILAGVLRDFAAAWSDHPDYRQEWKP